MLVVDLLSIKATENFSRFSSLLSTYSTKRLKPTIHDHFNSRDRRRDETETVGSLTKQNFMFFSRNVNCDKNNTLTHGGSSLNWAARQNWFFTPSVFHAAYSLIEFVELFLGEFGYTGLNSSTADSFADSFVNEFTSVLKKLRTRKVFFFTNRFLKKKLFSMLNIAQHTKIAFRENRLLETKKEKNRFSLSHNIVAVYRSANGFLYSIAENWTDRNKFTKGISHFCFSFRRKIECNFSVSFLTLTRLLKSLDGQTKHNLCLVNDENTKKNALALRLIATRSLWMKNVVRWDFL